MTVVSARFTRLLLAVLVCVGMVAGGAGTAFAKPKFAAFAVDARTGRILFDADANGLRYPASLTKMMTLYILFQELKAGRVKLSTPLRVSRRAASMAPSKLGLKPGSTITVEKAIQALVIKSANDVAATVGENLAGGNESAFAVRMTRTARSIGMSRTTFKNASGLPNPGQMTTARDMATLGLRLMRDFPQYYPYFRAQSFTFNGRTIRTHNKLVGNFRGTDGIKTGYIGAAGFNLVTSTLRDGRRVVGVVLGARSTPARNAYMMSMINSVMPKCKPGNTIAALPGSAKGAINPVVVAAKSTAPDADVAALASPDDDQPNTAALASVAASASTDEDSEDGAPADEGSNTPAPAKPTVVEATLGGKAAAEPLAPTGKLPFAVKPLVKQNQVATIGDADENWSVQVSSYKSKAEAQNAIIKLKSSAKPVLNGAQAFTVAVKKGNATTYRVLFSGLSEESARQSCAKVSNLRKTCDVVAPQG